MRWNKEKIEKQRAYFIEQRKNPTGKFTEFVVRTYYYIYKKCLDSDKGIVRSTITYHKDLVNLVYEGIYIEPDHMGTTVVQDCVNNLKELGYIGFKKIEDRWYIYIKNKLDFLLAGEHEEYIKKYGIKKEIS